MHLYLAVIMLLGNLLETQILRPYPRCAKSETLEMGLSNLCFRKFKNLRTTILYLCISELAYQKSSVSGEAALNVDSLMTSQLLLSCEHICFSLEITVLQKKIEDVVGKLCFH